MKLQRVGVLVAGFAAMVFAATASADVMISELQPNPPGTDPATQELELSGMAGDMFTGYVLSVDTDFSPGNTVDRAEMISGTFDSAGLLTVSIADLENPSFTLLVVDTFTGMTGDILDSNDDLMTLGITTVFDAVNTPDSPGDASNSIISALGVGTDLGFTGGEPELIFRDSITGEFVQLDDDNVFAQDGTLLGSQADFGLSIAGTFGSVNPSVVPEPSTFAMLGVCGLALVSRRRR